MSSNEYFAAICHKSKGRIREKKTHAETAESNDQECGCLDIIDALVNDKIELQAQVEILRGIILSGLIGNATKQNL